MTRREHHELAYSWPALVFFLAIVFCFVSITGVSWAKPAAWVCLIGSFFPCSLIRDWWVSR